MQISAHKMLRENDRSNSTVFNRDSFVLVNAYEYGAEYLIEVFDKEMNPISLEEWRSNLSDNKIKISAGGIKKINLQFRPRKTERKYYVCSKLIGAQGQQITLLSRICLRLRIYPTLS